MKKVTILVVLVLILALSTLPAAAITGGVADGDGHPNVGFMVAEEIVDDQPVRWRCSGTLIAPRVFLTAGHCVHNMDAAWVWFGSDMSGVSGDPRDNPDALPGQPIAHPDYIWSGSDFHDVGVVILEQAVNGIELATLAPENLLTQMKKDRILKGGYETGIYFRSVGYGVVLKSWPPPLLSAGNEPKIDKIRMMSESEFASLTKSLLHLFQRAVFDESGACFGDSGGPVFWEDAEGKEHIVAVTSSGDANCLAASFRYRVDVPEIREWIYSQFPEDE